MAAGARVLIGKALDHGLHGLKLLLLERIWRLGSRVEREITVEQVVT